MISGLRKEKMIWLGGSMGWLWYDSGELVCGLLLTKYSRNQRETNLIIYISMYQSMYSDYIIFLVFERNDYVGTDLRIIGIVSVLQVLCWVTLYRGYTLWSTVCVWNLVPLWPWCQPVCLAACLRYLALNFCHSGYIRCCHGNKAVWGCTD